MEFIPSTSRIMTLVSSMLWMSEGADATSSRTLVTLADITDMCPAMSTGKVKNAGV